MSHVGHAGFPGWPGGNKPFNCLIVLDERPYGLADIFRSMDRHVCNKKDILSCDDPIRRRIMWCCARCGRSWEIGLQAVRKSPIPLVECVCTTTGRIDVMGMLSKWRRMGLLVTDERRVR